MLGVGVDGRGKRVSWKDSFSRENRYFELEDGILYLGKSEEILRGFPDESVDVVITDPPYGLRKTEEWDGFEYFEKMLEMWLFECWRVSKNVVLWMCADKRIQLVLERAKNLGLRFHRNLIWIKELGSSFAGSSDFNLFYAHEHILVFAKKAKKTDFNKKKIGVSWFAARTEYGKTFGHPTTKPLVLMEDLVYYFSEEGEVVLDPFLGSGTTAVACKRLDRKWIGIEMNEEWLKVAVNRLKRVEEDFVLFGNWYKEERERNREIGKKIKR